MDWLDLLAVQGTLGDVCIQDVLKPKPLGVEVISFNGQPKPEVFLLLRL